ncbi:uncharacterized protein LACBIDRAFT_318373 [Laccaria bicolor S238N-H82]|uniref:Predicted protein n=1 Tax=Laccaria bicolor (strain S238N-H82 / ATCC MYA-4686) TaxID=486041 RepID=B0D6L4_LACBS|nr:uncharacterized protein LACBIDRAFT_318373 [Laccaria bicolor S238N-H82]EDR10207.1 predicted protein [Laccaria bicolor S238N-H82]|eukprot:XP_001879592.1 predicted protein [Laccaria bicolor S238N-H82]
MFAIGNGTDTPGMNQKLLPWLKARKGSRFGIITLVSFLLAVFFKLLDFYDAVPGLVEAVIGL